MYPIHQYLGIGGAGVWWPGRNPGLSHRLSTAEKELAHWKTHNEGLMVYTPIGGYTGSSTRTELAAAILALSANGPVHIGTDSQVFHDKAIGILIDIKHGRPSTTNWMLASDGDLWHHFEVAARTKGRHAIRVSKVKGHIKQSQVDQGLHRQVDKDGNDQADAIADIATQMHGEGIIQMAQVLQRRHKNYYAFMHNVAIHIVEGYFIHRLFLGRKEDNSKRMHPPILYRPLKTLELPSTSDQDYPIQLRGSHQNYSSYCKKHAATVPVWNFLNTITLRKTDDQYVATSRIELYLLYRVQGYPKPIADKPSKARARATIHSQIKEFKLVVRGVIDRAAPGDFLKEAFRPMKVTHHRLLQLGVMGKITAISCSVLASHKAQNLVETNLIKLGHPLSSKQLKEFQDGKTMLKPCIPNWKGRAGWDSNLLILDKQSTNKEDPGVVIPHCQVKRPYENYLFQCPRCKANVSSSHPAFQLQDLDKVCKCKSCKASSRSSLWLCSCGAEWHTCTIHRQIPQQCSKKPPSSAPNAACKRCIGPLSQEQLLSVDAKRMRRSNSHLLPPSRNILSIKLQERFAHLL